MKLHKTLLPHRKPCSSPGSLNKWKVTSLWQKVMLRSQNLLNLLIVTLLLLTANTTTFAQIELDSTDIHIFSNPKSGYVVRGEQFETEIIVMVDSVVLRGQNLLIRVNDKQLFPENGRARYTQFARQYGRNTYTVAVTVLNDSTTITRAQDFYFEAGERCISASAAKSNVMYVGVDNPVFVTAAGISSEDVQVSVNGATLSKSYGHIYNVRTDKPGTITLQVKAGIIQSDFTFRAKSIPDPTPLFGGMILPEQMEPEAFREQGGVGLLLNDFDFVATCTMLQYEVVQITATGKRTAITNTGARFGEAVLALTGQAAPGDLYWFRNIECQCPGDNQARKIQGFAVEIK